MCLLFGAVAESPGCDDWISVPQAGRLLGLQFHTIHRLIRSGELPADFVLPYPGPKSRRRAIRIRRRDVEEFIERARIQPGELRHLHPEWTWERYGDG